MIAASYAQIQARHALERQLASARKVITDHGDIVLDEELAMALLTTLRPILMNRAGHAVTLAQGSEPGLWVRDA